MSQPNLHDFLLLYEKVGFYTPAILVGVYASLLDVGVAGADPGESDAAEYA